MENVAGKVAFVTGGASGIGLATAQLFITEGARVITFDINAPPANLTSSNGLSLRLDVRSASQVETAIQQVMQNYGQLDILINIAGGSGRKWGDGPTDACTLEGWDMTPQVLENVLPNWRELRKALNAYPF